ncbi:MAG: acetolactate synthase small subunit [Rickettsiales bacterium]|nr:acetolactate synthase small subunit [Rickettsiales bacterium]
MGSETEKSLVSVLTLNIKGQLGKITTFFSEHNLNILRLVLSAADKDDKIHRAIAYLEGNREYVNAMCKELEKVENIVKVVNFQTNDEYIEKEMCLVKVSAYNSKIDKIMNLVRDADGSTLVSKGKVIIFKIEGAEEEVNDFVMKLNSITKEVEIARSGMVAMAVNDMIDVI